MTAVTVVYLLILTTGNMGPTVRTKHGTWWECEQARIRVERQTKMIGRCNAVSAARSEELLKPAPLPRPRVRIRTLPGR